MKTARIVFLDYLRVIACLMVMVIHATEPYYLNADGLFIANRADALWVTLVECLCRICVPLFVIASSYLLFPVKGETGAFFRRRLSRVLVPFVVWTLVYVACFDGDWGRLLFNFPDAGGHLWFVPMLLGLYLLMPLLSPWAERVGRKELRGWIFLWLLTTLFPYFRHIWAFLFGEPSFGSVPYLWGECPWNEFGAFHYVSGFVGYLLIGLWFRRFAATPDIRQTVRVAVPLWIVGVVLMGGLFFGRMSRAFPWTAPYAAAVDLEMGIEYCSLGVALAVIGAFMFLRHIRWDGAFYARVVRPLAEASYGMYLVHLLVLVFVSEALKPILSTPLCILATAVSTFAASALITLVIRRIPKVGSWIGG